jgi:hypothetical protein
MIRKFLGFVLPGVIKPLHALWNQVIGFLFLCFTILAGFYAFRALRAFTGDAEGLFRIVVPGFFAMVMAFFAFTSFWKARKISRS